MTNSSQAHIKPEPKDKNLKLEKSNPEFKIKTPNIKNPKTKYSKKNQNIEPKITKPESLKIQMCSSQIAKPIISNPPSPLKEKS